MIVTNPKEFKVAFLKVMSPQENAVRDLWNKHRVYELVSQRAYGLCFGNEDLNDHDLLRADPLLALLCGKQDLEGKKRRNVRDCGKPLAGKSTLNRLETAGSLLSET